MRALVAIAASRAGSAANAEISDASRSGVNSALRNPQGRIGLRQHAGIGELVLIDRAGQRHQDRGPADRGEFGDGAGAGARHHQMARRQPRRQIAEERRQLGIDLEPVIDRAYPRHVFLAHLLRQDQAAPQRRLQPSRRADGTMSLITRAPWLPPTTSRRKRPVRFGRSKRHRGGGKDRGTHRRADGRGLAGQRRIAIEHAGQRGRDRIDAAGEKTVGAAEHGVGVVNDGGHAEQFCRHQRRHRRIAAEADHGRGLQPPHQIGRHQRAVAEHERGTRQRHRIAAAHGLARHHVDIVRGEQPAVAQRAGIGRQPHPQAAPDQLDAERFGGKQMAAGAARGEKDQRGVHGFK